MSTNYRRFTNSTSENYNNNTKLENGNLTWDTDNGLRLHDGQRPGGNPVIGIHDRWNTQAQITGVSSNGNGTFIVAQGDQTGQGWAQLGRVFYFERDIDENQQTITSCSYDSGNNITLFTVNGGSFNGYTPVGGEYIYQTVQPLPISQLAEGPGISLNRNNERIIVDQRFFGQSIQYLSEYTLTNGLQINNIEKSLISVFLDPNYTTWTSGDTHVLTLPFDGMQNPYWNPDASLSVGTRVTVINHTEVNLEVTGWPGPGFTVQPYGSTVDLVYLYNPFFGGNLWHVVGSFTWM